ncbi:MAG TPA: HAMP domain-containing sensor histidine kinase, partial [Gemmatimonadaceae bacterium]|nr:HAMP domain-containing sensor histidine kinase [Gemmatimonadaceae bacterium]
MLDITAHCPLATALAQRMRAERDDLTRRWLDRIADRVALERNRVFPTDDLLDHVPLLISGIADYIEDPARVVAADAAVVGKAMELGALRHAQGVDEYEILKEYEIFGGILFAFLARTTETIDAPCTRAELLVCAHRLFRAVSLIQQASVTQFLQLTKSRLAEREERLRGFNRAVTHELKNRIGAAMGAAQILEMEAVGEAERRKLVDVVLRNVVSMRGVLDNLLELSRTDVDTRQQRRVLLPQVVAEACRQVRDLARAEGVELRLGELPAVEVPAAAVELALTNFLSNAIKYADPTKAERWAEVRGRVVSRGDGPACETVVEVRDNGLGVPPEKRAHLFER